MSGEVPMTLAEDSADTRKRERWVDTLRVVLIAGVIVVHTATGYVADFAGFYYDDELAANTVVSIAFALPALLGGIFGLGPLFVVAGWFSVRWRDADPPASWAAGCSGSAYRCSASCWP